MIDDSVMMAKITPEHFRQLREWGFVPYRDKNGRLLFAEREEYLKLLASGKIGQGASLQ